MDYENDNYDNDYDVVDDDENEGKDNDIIDIHNKQLQFTALDSMRLHAGTPNANLNACGLMYYRSDRWRMSENYCVNQQIMV